MNWPIDEFVQAYPEVVKKFAPILGRLLSIYKEYLLGSGFESGNLKRKLLFGEQGKHNFVPIPSSVWPIDWMIHNHPSGNLFPSRADMEQSAAAGARYFGIISPFHDSVLEFFSPNNFKQFENNVFSNIGRRIDRGNYEREAITASLRAKDSPSPEEVMDIWKRNFPSNNYDVVNRITPTRNHSLLGEWLQLIREQPSGEQYYTNAIAADKAIPPSFKELLER